MKHARKKTSATGNRKSSAEKSTPRRSKSTPESYHRTDADFRKKYLYDDEYDAVSRRIASSGYKPRSLDSYIPADKLESKVKRRDDSGDTRRLNTSAIRSAAEEDMKHKRAASSTKKATGRTAAKKTSSAKKTTAKESGTANKAAPAKKKTSAKKSKDSRSTKRLLGRIAAVAGVAVFIACIVLIGIGAGMYSAVANELEDMNVKNLALNYSSFVYYNDKDGNAQELLQLHYEGERRIWVDSAQISQNLKNAAVSIEDERFYKHNGIDLKRTAGATVGWVLSKIGIGDASYGGSTITQQLIKNITNEKDKSVTRKVKEMMRAVALEKQLNDKDAILTMYLNISYFSNQCNGVEAASNLYFSKHASEVSIAEAATIVGITQRPTYYDPIRNPDNALAKRNVVLDKMYEHKYITKDEYNAAKESPLGLSESAISSKKTVYSYFVDQVINDVTNDLIEQKGYAEQFAEQQVYSGGLKIYTTMDKDIQAAMESVYENRTGFPKNTKPQSAMIIIDQYTGEIKGIVGGAGQKTEARGLNRATQSKRQPGSSIKPLSVYAPGIELGKINSGTVLRDEKITIGNWSPVNSYTGFKGDLVLRKAIEISANIPAVKALQLLGIENSYDYLTSHFGLTSLVPDDKSLASLGLGGLTNGVTVREMAGAYAAIANNGMYIKPYTYTKVVDSTGKVLLENTPQPKRAISEATAFIITDLLSEVINGSSGTGRAAKLSSGMPAYGKTGTTNENKDKWFAGFTKYYTGVVWFGFDQPANLRTAGVTNNPSCVIWKNVMDKVHSGLSKAEYTAPDSVKRTVICTKTGKRASSGCGYAKSEYFVTGNVPSHFCKLAHGSDEKETTSATPGAATSNEVSASPDSTAQPASTATTPPASVPDTPAATPAPKQDNTAPVSDGTISLD